MKKYYLEITNKEDGLFMFQSKWFRTPQQVKKWVAENIDHIDFENYYVNIMFSEFNKDEYGDILRHSYIDYVIFKNLKNRR